MIETKTIPRSIALVYNLVDDPERVDINSIVDSAASIRTTLEALGHRVDPIAVSDGIGPFVRRIETNAPDLVFNLCEGYRDSCEGQFQVPALLELAGVPYTGAGPVALALALDKPLCKRLLQASNIPTPAFDVHVPRTPVTPPRAYPAILKLAAEDASVGITRENVVRDDTAFFRRLAELFAEFQMPVMSEAFIDGREFTVPLLDGEPIALEEIEFSVEPKIVCYAAKWRPGTPEYHGTTPQFAPRVSDGLRTEMLCLARRVHDLIGMRDYARVDFRLDTAGQVYVLEANPNPDITPGSGFCLALDAAGIAYSDFIAGLVETAARRRGRQWVGC